MNILIAFDKFKDSMSAKEACESASAGAREALGESVQITQCPLTDGGEGFCPILTTTASGHLEHHTVTGPLGDDIQAPLGWVPMSELPDEARRYFGNAHGKLAIIEMASAAGLEQVPSDQRHPKQCTTRGVGELIRIAVARGAGAILLGIGGSATSDLGLGALEAMGIEFPGTREIIPEKWPAVESVTGFIDFKLPPIFIACDVDNPLIGERGAAAVYGPQKGLRAEEIAPFDAQAERMADMLCAHFGQDLALKNLPGSGAAGGIGFGLKVACGAEFVAGFDLVKCWLDLEMKAALADLILTGEGKFDQSSLSGKGPYALIESASQAGVPFIVLAGKAEEDAAEIIRERYADSAVYSISPKGAPLAEALAQGPENLQTATFSALRNPPHSDD
ncbi:glycerate kinase [Coraliomargarita akajimensis]|uniref:Glycerate kinase n=1 Tax=Coraliomargarita akajimensis (strain DSM 45221 / IAM 15411 / JCM 23193 / KCTC 12865 / 04OKA010-24) TaxID=583355 RepID=D5EK03_CORAD|nr:glycerate kinase [Coraliomargarita akajimensis]ADE54752.1 glycerate kinase [Coraliomargarita akajimensis DSM 45221]